MFCGRPVQLFARLLHTSSICRIAVDKTQLSRLRKKTGFPFIKCKNALVQFENDLPKAESWLREQAQKEGWTKATKLQGRAMSHGLVAIMLDKSAAVMIEVNCETDFVARNAKFQELVSLSAKTFLEQSQHQEASKLLWDGEAISKLSYDDERTIADMVALQVGHIGENMAIRRGAYLSTAAADSSLGSYIHASGVDIIRREQCIMGKFGSLVLLTGPSAESELSRDDLGRQLAQHVVGMNPRSIGSLEDALLQMENTDEAEESSEDSSTESSGEDESKGDPSVQEEEEAETRMVFQEFLLEPQRKVADLLQQNSAEVLDYVRFECGEVTPEDDEAGVGGSEGDR